jgi:hypothetical protein
MSFGPRDRKETYNESNRLRLVNTIPYANPRRAVLETINTEDPRGNEETMTPYICFELHLAFDISLVQTGIDAFTVIYGKQVKKYLNYHDAALELGACIMHALACEGKLDNREEEENND